MSPPDKDQLPTALGSSTAAQDELDASKRNGTLPAQGQIATERIAQVDSVFGLHTPPPGTKLYVQEGSIEGTFAFFSFHVDFGGGATIVASDPRHLEITVYPEGSYNGTQFKREYGLRFEVRDASTMRMDSDLKDPSKPADKPTHESHAFKLTQGATPDHVRFKDEKKNESGSLSWDPSTQLLTILYGKGQKVVLGPNPPAKKTS